MQQSKNSLNWCTFSDVIAKLKQGYRFFGTLCIWCCRNETSSIVLYAYLSAVFYHETHI